MNDKEYTYDIDKYTIGVDTNGEDEIGMAFAKVENGEIYFLGNCYGENARCIDLLLKENQELKKQLEERNIEYFKGAYDTHDKYYTQQKEFIKYLEDYINSLKKEYGNYVNDNYSEEYGRYYTAKEILQKYKDIIGEIK